MFTLFLLAFFFVLGILAGSVFLWISAKLFLIKPIRFRTALFAFVIVFLLGLALEALFSFLPGQPPLGRIAKGVAQLIVGLLAAISICSWSFQTTFVRAFLIIVLTSACNLLFTGATFYLIVTFIFSSYIKPTNPMAPTIIGIHHDGICPNCAGKAIIPYREGDVPEDEIAICSQCYQIHKVKPTSNAVLPGERFLCNKLLAPRRWDIVVYRFPQNPDLLYVNRLVGFPGEEILIKEGSIWIDGKNIEPPEEIKKLRWTHRVGIGDFENLDDALKAEKDVEPVRLSPNGYFVLGDFTLRSSDSRVWGEVPAENLVGVATLMYWPPERWRIFR